MRRKISMQLSDTFFELVGDAFFSPDGPQTNEADASESVLQHTRCVESELYVSSGIARRIASIVRPADKQIEFDADARENFDSLMRDVRADRNRLADRAPDVADFFSYAGKVVYLEKYFVHNGFRLKWQRTKPLEFYAFRTELVVCLVGSMDCYLTSAVQQEKIGMFRSSMLSNRCAAAVGAKVLACFHDGSGGSQNSNSAAMTVDIALVQGLSVDDLQKERTFKEKADAEWEKTLRDEASYKYRYCLARTYESMLIFFLSYAIHPGNVENTVKIGKGTVFDTETVPQWLIDLIVGTDAKSIESGPAPPGSLLVRKYDDLSKFCKGIANLYDELAGKNAKISSSHTFWNLCASIVSATSHHARWNETLDPLDENNAKKSWAKIKKMTLEADFSPDNIDADRFSKFKKFLRILDELLSNWPDAIEREQKDIDLECVGTVPNVKIQDAIDKVTATLNKEYDDFSSRHRRCTIFLDSICPNRRKEKTSTFVDVLGKSTMAGRVETNAPTLAASFESFPAVMTDFMKSNEALSNALPSLTQDEREILKNYLNSQMAYGIYQQRYFVILDESKWNFLDKTEIDRLNQEKVYIEKVLASCAKIAKRFGNNWGVANK